MVRGTKEVKEVCKWSGGDVRELCIREHYYTCGSCSDYSTMLEFVDENEPTTENMFDVAQDIYEHSGDGDNVDLEHIMFLLSREVVRRHYFVR